ncbi:MAG: hypothetical protein E7439_06790 [Ruminococcaceae bacterium]|nr:hypothetical protein [Oscillospiraceae bacterium]
MTVGIDEILKERQLCFLFGHGDCPEDLFPKIVQAVEVLIVEHGCRNYYLGHRGDFDRLATRAVIALKEKYPFISVQRLIAYYEPHKPVYCPTGVDGTYYPPGMEMVPKSIAIRVANERMIDDADFIICYVNHHLHNAHKALEYAQRKKGITIINLGTYNG